MNEEAERQRRKQKSEVYFALLFVPPNPVSTFRDYKEGSAISILIPKSTPRLFFDVFLSSGHIVSKQSAKPSGVLVLSLLLQMQCRCAQKNSFHQERVHPCCAPCGVSEIAPILPSDSFLQI